MIYKESETIEFKKTTAGLKEAVISIVAMLNKHGSAKVYFGIADDGKIIGQMVGRKTIKDIERWGSGIKRIHDECAAVGVKVDFKRLKTGFVVVFHRPKWEEGEGLEKGGQKGWSEKVVRKGGQKLTTKQIAIIDLIKQHPTISRKDIAVKMGINESAVQKRLEVLKKKGVLRRTGPDKGGRWEVLEHYNITFQELFKSPAIRTALIEAYKTRKGSGQGKKMLIDDLEQRAFVK